MGKHAFPFHAVWTPAVSRYAGPLVVPVKSLGGGWGYIVPYEREKLGFQEPWDLPCEQQGEDRTWNQPSLGLELCSLH